MSKISEEAFERGFTTGNENIDHFIKATTSGKLEPDSDRDSNVLNFSKYLDISSVKLAKCEIPLFKLNDEVNILLKNTNNKSYYRPLPFQMMFIDITDTCDSGEALKPHDQYGNVVKSDNGTECKKISCCGFLLFDTGKEITVTSPLVSYWENSGKKIGEFYAFWDSNIGGEITRRKEQVHLIPKEIKEKYKEYICNLLDFINHPEVEFICSERHNRNDRRIKNGKKPLFTKYNLVLKGELKKYVYKTIEENNKSWELGYRFWVRGHWVNFKSERYKNMVGKKTWILPYIKGKGELITKDYYLGEKEKQWENERRMKKLIKLIFYNKKIKYNSRIELNGLEIDCYVPELKLGFEYNGLQHYEWIEIFHKTKEQFELQKQRDIQKNNLAQEKGIKLITIKYDEPLTEEHILNRIKEVDNGKSKRE